jgi:hypothetical protein
MNRTFIAIALATAILSGSAAAATADYNTNLIEEGENTTLIEECDRLPSTARIEGLSNANTIDICQAMMLRLDGATTIRDLRSFSELASRIATKGYRGGDYGSTASDIVQIIAQRGLYDNEPRWNATINLIWDLFYWEKVTATPLLISEFLASAGPERANSITDDELIKTMIDLAE